MRFLWLVLLLCTPISVRAADYCTREKLVDPEFPAGLAGTYELVGKDAATGAPYVGTLEVAAEKARYVLTRKSPAGVVKGEGWIERCGADRTIAFVARYHTLPDATELFCSLGSDGDNYYRVTCRSRIARNGEANGLEAWFQQH